jgi:hypothetical protein
VCIRINVVSERSTSGVLRRHILHRVVLAGIGAGHRKRNKENLCLVFKLEICSMIYWGSIAEIYAKQLIKNTVN